jgi:hypothetical protein
MGLVFGVGVFLGGGLLVVVRWGVFLVGVLVVVVGVVVVLVLGHRRARRLFAVAQGGVENSYRLQLRIRAGHDKRPSVRRASATSILLFPIP